MSHLRRSITVVACAIFSIWALGAACAATAYPIVDKPVTLASNEQVIDDVWGAKILYEDYVSHGSDSEDGNHRLYLYDTSTEASTPITPATISVADAAMCGDWVVYRMGAKLCSLNLQTEATRTITTHGSLPDVYGSYVVYEDARRDPGDIIVYNLVTHASRRITGSGTQSAPSIWGTKVAYQGVHSGKNTDIYLYDISSRRTTRVAASTDPESSPRLSGSIVAYDRDHRMNWGYNRDVYVRDLGSGKTTRVTNNALYDRLLGVWGSRVLYCGADGGLYLYDALGDTSWALGPSSYDAALWNETVAWTDRRNSTSYEDSGLFNLDVYWGRIDAPRITSALPTRPRYGHTATVTSQLKYWNGDAFRVSVLVVLQSSTNKKIWTTVDTVRTLYPFGTATLHSHAIRRTTYLRVAFLGDANRHPAVGSVITVRPR